MKKIYLSMPISGYDLKKVMELAEREKERLSSDKTEIITPFDACPYDPNKTYGQCMKECIKELLLCDAIMFEPNWYKSNGCRIEAEVARGCEIEMIFL